MKCSGTTGLGIENFKDIQVGVSLKDVRVSDPVFDPIEDKEIEELLQKNHYIENIDLSTSLHLSSGTFVTGIFR